MLSKLSALALRYRLLLAAACGVFAMLTLPPFFIFPLVIPAYTGLFLLCFTTSRRRDRFWTSWAFGLGYFSSGLYWFANALLLDAASFGWMIPFAVFGLPAILGIYYGIAVLLWHEVTRRLRLSDFSAVMIFALLLALAELARGYCFTGFPWNLPALSWAGSLPLLQLGYHLGAYGLSGYILLLAILPAAYCLTGRILPLLVCLFMLVVPYGYGLWRLEQHPTAYTDTRLRLVQPSIAQQLKWQANQRVNNLMQHIELSRENTARKADIILWSESAYPYLMASHTPPLQYVAREILTDKQLLFTGAVREDAEGNVYHGLSVVNHEAKVVAQYDKSRLVPFGEYVPLRQWLPIQKITHGMRDFTAGKVGVVMEMAGIPAFLPLICYEVIFPEMSRAEDGGVTPRWLLNLTNDGWYGESTGPYQHFHMARMRAVEQGLPMVRVANNGISAVIDPVGRITAFMPLNHQGAVTARLPEAL